MHFSKNLTRFILSFSMLLMGACGLIYEYKLGLLGNNMVGSSHEQLFMVIGIMMFAMGLGAILQRQFDKNLIDTFLITELILGLVGGTSALAIYTAYVFLAHYAVILYGLSFFIGLLIGLEIPLLIRINEEYSVSLKTNLSEILCMDYVGSLIGAILFTYFLLKIFSLSRLCTVLGMANLSLALLGLWYFGPLVKYRRHLWLASGAVLAILATCCYSADRVTDLLEQRCYEDPIDTSITSQYQHLVITKRGDHTRLYINNQLQFDSHDEYIYHESLTMIPAVLHPNPERVAILGGGDGLAAKVLLTMPSVKSIQLVDIDPAIIKLAQEHPTLVQLNNGSLINAKVSATIPKNVKSAGKRLLSAPTRQAEQFLENTVYQVAEVEVYTVDADLFIRGLAGPFDLVIVDFPDPETVELAKLYSRDFYENLKHVLAPGGLVAIQSTSPYRANLAFRCIGTTLKAAGFNELPYHEYLPSFGDWGFHLAWVGGPTESERREQIKALTSIPWESRYLTIERMKAAFDFGRGLLDGPAVAVNTKMRPVINDYYFKSNF